MNRVALLGASGFVGSQVHTALELQGAAVVPVSAPRLTTPARDLAGLVAEIESSADAPETLALKASLSDCDAVVNAAGVASAAGDGDALFGANALLPGLLAAATPADARLVHISSAAVQGRRRVLTETEETAAFSPYSLSKALGEQAAWAMRSDAVCYRPTSVHGTGRPVTLSLARLLRSPLASVAGPGDLPTPQVQVENVGDAAAFLATTEDHPPRVVLHPSEGLTTGDFVRTLGHREPWHVPTGLARAAVSIAFGLGRVVPRSAGLARRVEMLWFGQVVGQSWLAGRWSPVKGQESWKDLT